MRNLEARAWRLKAESLPAELWRLLRRADLLEFRRPKPETRKKVEGRNPNKIRKALVFRWSAGFMDSRMETAASDGA